MADLLHLNDDCLGHIFMLLDLQSCEQVRQVCQRFEHIIRVHCQRKYKLWSSKNGSDFAWLAENMNNTVEELELPDTTDEHYTLLARYKFPHCKSLAVSGSTAKRTKSIVKAFPNLQRLLLVESVGLKALLELSDLEELIICFAEYDEIQHFSEMFKRLKLCKLHVMYTKQHIFPKEDFQTVVKCETLKDIALHGDLMNIALYRLHLLPHLEKIAYVHEPYGNNFWIRSVFDSLLNDFRDRITTLYSTELLGILLLDSFYDVPNLRTLVVHDKMMKCYLPENINFELLELRELHFLNENCYFIIKNADECLYDEYADFSCFEEFNFLRILKSLANLELLVVPFKWLNEKFLLPHLLETLQKQSHTRHNKLELRCWVRSPEDVDTCTAEIDRLVKDTTAVTDGIWLERVTVVVYNPHMDKFDWCGIKNYSFQIVLEKR